MVALIAFLIANAEMSVTGLLTGDADRRANGGFGAVVFALLLIAMVRRLTAPLGRRCSPSDGSAGATKVPIRDGDRAR